MKKLFALVSILVLAAMALPACGPAAPDCTQPDIICVGLVTDVGKIDDKSFNQSAWEGVLAAQDADIIDWAQYIETTDAKDYDKNIATFADAGYDIIVTVGFNLTEQSYTAALEYPDVLFIGVDQFLMNDETHADWPLANLTGLVFPEDQSGFLSGALAALMSTTGKIGAVCGTDLVPPVWRFGEGYKAGAAYVNPDVEVFVVYHNDVGFDKTFIDPEWGATTAQTMIDNGADVIFGCGGKTGNGAVVQAAEAGIYAIGVDADQYYTLPEAAPRMLSSAMKLLNPGVYAIIRLAILNQFPGGLYTGAVSLAPYHDLAADVSPEIDAQLQDLAAQLTSGELETGVSPVKPAE